MYRIEKTFSISASHHLPKHPGKCAEVHGHNWKITVICEAEELNDQGMVLDFGEIKSVITELLDHQNLNTHIPNPTAERIAHFLCGLIGDKCVEVQVEETEGSKACYIK